MSGLPKTFSNMWNLTNSELYQPPPITVSSEEEEVDDGASQYLSPTESVCIDIHDGVASVGVEEEKPLLTQVYPKEEENIPPPPSMVTPQPNNSVIIESFDENTVCMRFDSLFYKETYTKENLKRFIVPIGVGMGLLGWILWFTTL